jgi:hypothetical protein
LQAGDQLRSTKPDARQGWSVSAPLPPVASRMLHL